MPAPSACPGCRRIVCSNDCAPLRPPRTYSSLSANSTSLTTLSGPVRGEGGLLAIWGFSLSRPLTALSTASSWWRRAPTLTRRSSGGIQSKYSTFLYLIQHCTSTICIDGVYTCCFILSIHALKAEAHRSHIWYSYVDSCIFGFGFVPCIYTSRNLAIALREVLCYTVKLRMLTSMLFLLLMVVGDVA
jgi:hypothetical protein